MILQLLWGNLGRERIMKKFVTGQKYRVKKDFYIDCGPLKYFAKKNELLAFEGISLYAHFRGFNPNRLVLMSKKEAFEFLEEIKN